jgi:DNA polymerase-3 subunit gamma/tau
MDLLDALVRRDATAALAVADAMEARSLSFDNALGELARLLHRIALVQAAPDALPEDLPERERIAALAGAIDPEDAQLYYQIALQARKDLALAPDEYAGFTMATIRMLVFAPEHSGERAAVAPGPLRHGSGQSAPTAASAPRSASTGPGEWPAVARALKLTGAAKQLAERSELARFDGDRLELVVPPESRALADKGYVDKVKTALADHYGRPISVTVRVGVVNGHTAAAVADGERRARAADANAQIGDDPFVRELVAGLDATIESVKPADQGTRS